MSVANLSPSTKMALKIAENWVLTKESWADLSIPQALSNYPKTLPETQALMAFKREVLLA